MQSNPILDLVGGEAALSPLIARAHSGHVRLIGTVDVDHGGLPASLLAKFAGMPPAGRNIPFSLTAHHHANAVTWLRSFDGMRFDSVFERDGDHLIERHGPLCLKLKLAVGDGRLRYRLVSATLLGVELAAWMLPTIDAWETEEGGRYHFEVQVSLPGVGRLARYGGVLDPV